MRDVLSRGTAPSLAVPLGLVEDAFRRLEKRLEGMTEEEYHFTGPDDANSTAMLLRHLILVDLTYLHIMMGDLGKLQEIQAKYGPFQDESGRIPGVAGASGSALLEEYRGVIEMVRQYVSGLTDEAAAREVKVPWWPEPATVRYMLWHMASHSSHHQGQIARLRAAYKQR
ncbi:putative damage-inducible protein DinB [Symbiobacterium terraclitae]|uniref:Damage-inducible protein DinB n=1 Tax=Symbiobacterium terraclitae TaxID=557451 RepID=A0ABS4JWU0_9FIRM|nr:DinB family protein [Symbiobacterium terraclitae]MBP2018934.1 putative damage-inducible protein DinB [Symbiobacterium terraclitae]